MFVLGFVFFSLFGGEGGLRCTGRRASHRKAWCAVGWGGARRGGLSHGERMDEAVDKICVVGLR